MTPMLIAITITTAPQIEARLSMIVATEESDDEIVLASGTRMLTTRKDLPRHGEGFIRRAMDRLDSTCYQIWMAWVKCVTSDIESPEAFYQFQQGKSKAENRSTSLFWPSQLRIYPTKTYGGVGAKL